MLMDYGYIWSYFPNLPISSSQLEAHPLVFMDNRLFVSRTLYSHLLTPLTEQCLSSAP